MTDSAGVCGLVASPSEEQAALSLTNAAIPCPSSDALLRSVLAFHTVFAEASVGSKVARARQAPSTKARSLFMICSSREDA